MNLSMFIINIYSITLLEIKFKDKTQNNNLPIHVLCLPHF